MYHHKGYMALVISIAHAKTITDLDAKIGERKSFWLDERESLRVSSWDCTLHLSLPSWFIFDSSQSKCCLRIQSSSSLSHLPKGRVFLLQTRASLTGVRGGVGFGLKVNNKGALWCLLLYCSCHCGATKFDSQRISPPPNYY